MEQKVTAFSNFGKIKYLVFSKTNNFHKFLCSLISNLGFGESEIEKADRIFTEMFDDYMLLRKDATKFHLFITSRKIHFVIDSDNSDMIVNEIKKQVKFL